jgi:hypothetical protein
LHLGIQCQRQNHGAALDTAKTLGTLPRGEELVVIGAEKDGYINVQGVNDSGWVKVVLMQKR